VPGSCPCLPHASKQCRMEGGWVGGITVLWFKTCSQKGGNLFKIGKRIKRNKKSFILRMVFLKTGTGNFVLSVFSMFQSSE
jgi:hypothetical protein